jgi:aminoglycoside 3-N-acetyltransferase
MRNLALVIKQIIKKKRKQLRGWWYSKFYSFSQSDLTEALLSLGIRAGDVVLVHVAYNEFTGFTGRPSDVLNSLRSAVAEAGTLLMPSMPFTGTAVDYVRSGQMFDVRRTASCMGLVTELFRRCPGTIRSLHPTHPVLANGPRAKEMVQDHPLAHTPCGKHSPFAKLAEIDDGKIALLGTGIGSLTFYHYLEELLEGMLPPSPFTKESFNIAFRGYDGEMVNVTTRLFDAALSRRRDLGILERELKRNGGWRERKLGRRVPLAVLEAQVVRDTVRAMAENGMYCYV